MAGDSNARFSSSLQPFRRYELQTRTLGWNQKWIFCEHRFVRGDRVCALVVVRYLFVSKRGPVPPSKVMALSGGEPQTPTLPRSEERRVGKECVRTCRSRCSPEN